MEGFNWSTLGWIAGLIFVYVFGIFEGRSQGRKRRIVEEAQEKMEQPMPTPVITKVDDPGLLRLKNEDGVMTLDLDGNRMDSTSLNAEQRKRLIELLNIMRPWLDGKPVSASSPTSAPPTKLNEVPAPPAPVKQTTSTTPTQAVSTKKKNDEVEAAPASIVGQINTILQKRIVNTPLVSKGVSLMESVTGGVNVYVGVQRYETIDDVPDEEIRAAIRAAITEWENTYTPGL